MTRFALLTEFYPPSIGGIQSSLGPMAQMLGDDLTVIAPGEGQPGPRRMVRSLFSGQSWPRWWWLVSWLSTAKRRGLRVAIFGHFSAACFATLILGRRGPAYVVLVHGNDLLTEARRPIIRRWIGLILRRAVWVGVNSTYVENLVAAYGVRRASIVRTHPSVPLSADTAKTRGSEMTRFLTIARLVPRKNVTTVVTAMAEVIRRHPTVRYSIIGDGPERPAIEQTIRTQGMHENITLTGSVSEQEKMKSLDQADAFIMTPVIRQEGVDVEGLGLVYLEAAARGLPIIASATGGVGDIVIDQQTGLLVDPHLPAAITAAITSFIANPPAAAEYGRRARLLIQREFSQSVRHERLRTMLIGPSKLPSISIIIPAYQASSTIAATLESIKRQTWAPAEVIIINDGSTDGLAEAIAPYRTMVQYHRQSQQGAPAARNAGFARSSGQYVFFLDADTVLQPHALEQFAAVLLTHPEAAYSYSDFTFGWKRFHGREFSSTALRRLNYIHTCSLIRRSAFPGFDEHLKRFQDWDLWLTMAERGQRGIWIDQVLFHVTPRARGLGMSTWIPSFVYRLPGIGQGRGSATIAAYRAAEAKIRQKHPE